jgi:hypothetical protein
MAAVKRSKPTRLMVVPYRPCLRLLLVGGLSLALVLIASAGYLLGHYRGLALQAQAVEERDQLRRDLLAKVVESKALSQQVANLKLASEVDTVSSEEVRNKVMELQGQIAALEEDIAFYRSLMAPTANRRGLTIGSVDVISTGVPRRYDFKVVVQQLATNHQMLNGLLSIHIVGQEGEAIRRIPLNELSPQLDEEDIKLRFKYFQNIEGQLDLPPGFEPEHIELVARSTGADGTSIEKKFGWLVHES